MDLKRTIKDLQKQLKDAQAQLQREAAFKRMTKAEKRMAIAQDVIDSLKAKQLIAQNGVYLRLPTDVKDDDFRTALLKGQECVVCALGGLFTCAVKEMNKVTTENATQDFSQDEMQTYLSSIFPKQQLRLIEAAFERSIAFPGFGERQYNYETDTWEYIGEDGVNYGPAVKFGQKHDDDSKRMIAIMQNIVRNKGEFRP